MHRRIICTKNGRKCEKNVCIIKHIISILKLRTGEPIMIEPLLTVCIPTYNRMESVINTVKSILDSPVHNICVLVTDNCSTDNTIKRLMEISDSRLMVHKNNKNYGQVGGFAEALRVGALTGAKYLLLIIDRQMFITVVLTELMELLSNNDYSLIKCQSSFDGKNIVKQSGLDALLAIAYDWSAPSGVIYKTEYIQETLRNVSIEDVFNEYYHFPHDIWNVEMAIKGNICIYGKCCIIDQKHETPKSSAKKIDGNAWFTVVAGIKQFNAFIKHLTTLSLTNGEKELVFQKAWSNLVRHLMCYRRRVKDKVSADYYDTNTMLITYSMMIYESRRIRHSSLKSARINGINLGFKTRIKIALTPFYVTELYIKTRVKNSDY